MTKAIPVLPRIWGNGYGENHKYVQFDEGRELCNIAVVTLLGGKPYAEY